MGYVFFGGMRGTAWVNTFQTVLFLLVRRDRRRGDRRRHGRIPRGDGVDAGVAGDRAAPDARARVAALFLQLHVHPALVDRLSAHRHLLPDGAAAGPLPQDDRALPDLHARDLAAVGVSRRRRQSGDRDVPAISAKLEARATLAAEAPTLRARDSAIDLRAQAARRRCDSAAGRGLRAAVAGGAARRGGDGRGDGQRLADSRAVDDVHRGRVRVLRRHARASARRCRCRPAGSSSSLLTVVAYLIALGAPQSIFDLATQYAFAGYSALSPLLVAALFWKGSTKWGALAATRLDRGGRAGRRRAADGRARAAAGRRRSRFSRSAASTSSRAPRRARWCSACCRSCR